MGHHVVLQSEAETQADHPHMKPHFAVGSSWKFSATTWTYESIELLLSYPPSFPSSYSPILLPINISPHSYLFPHLTITLPSPPLHYSYILLHVHMKASSSFSHILPLSSLLILPFFSLHTYLPTPTYSLISLLPFLPSLSLSLPLPLTHTHVVQWQPLALTGWGRLLTEGQ